MKQLRKSVEVEKMPSVRVRPTLRVELKNRVLNCKLPLDKNSKHEPININDLNEKVLSAMRRSKRANMGSEHSQVNLMKSCEDEISRCKNLDEIRRNLESRQTGHTQEIQRQQQESRLTKESARSGSPPLSSKQESPIKFMLDCSQEENTLVNNLQNEKIDNFMGGARGATQVQLCPKKRHESLYSRH